MRAPCNKMQSFAVSFYSIALQSDETLKESRTRANQQLARTAKAVEDASASIFRYNVGLVDTSAPPLSGAAIANLFVQAIAEIADKNDQTVEHANKSLVELLLLRGERLHYFSALWRHWARSNLAWKRGAVEPHIYQKINMVRRLASPELRSNGCRLLHSESGMQQRRVSFW